MINKIEITNPDKIVYPKDGIKKIDVIEYYSKIAKRMLPFVENRPLCPIRCHGGIHGESFFKKHPTTDKNVEIFKYKNEEYFYIKDEFQLLYQAQMGTVEFHTWGTTVKKLKRPDVMVFDLDPDDKLPLDKLREAVIKVKSVIDGLGLKSFLKTSGGKGYHIVVPYKSSKNADTFYGFSRNIAVIAENQWSGYFTTNIRKSERNGKIFIDYLRNNLGSTCVAPYSLRARDGATVSMPISWKNLDKIAPNEVNIKNYSKYLNSAWKGFFSVEQELK